VRARLAYGLLGTLALLAGCGWGTPDAYLPNRSTDYVIFAFPEGDVIVRLEADNPATPWIMRLADSGYYDGSFIHRAIPGSMVQFGEAYWQGHEPSPHQRVALLAEPVLPERLQEGEAALPILAQPTSRTLILGPQILLGRGIGVYTTAIGRPVYRIGTVMSDLTPLNHAVKGDKILSANVGAVIAKPH
jgi:hypothetical protein